MTGSPGWYQAFSGTKPDTIWSLLNSEMAAGTMISAASKDSSFKYTDGIVNGHQYAIFGFF